MGVNLHNKFFSISFSTVASFPERHGEGVVVHPPRRLVFYDVAEISKLPPRSINRIVMKIVIRLGISRKYLSSCVLMGRWCVRYSGNKMFASLAAACEFECTSRCFRADWFTSLRGKTAIMQISLNDFRNKPDKPYTPFLRNLTGLHS